MARCPAHGNRIQLNSSRAVNLFGATPQPDCRRTAAPHLERAALWGRGNHPLRRGGVARHRSVPGTLRCHRFSPLCRWRRALSPRGLGSGPDAPGSAPQRGSAPLTRQSRQAAGFAPVAACLFALASTALLCLSGGPSGASHASQWLLRGDTRRELQCAQVAQGLRERLTPPLPSPARSLPVLCALFNGRITKVTPQELRSLARRCDGA
jgi:hypothetical protein